MEYQYLAAGIIIVAVMYYAFFRGGQSIDPTDLKSIATPEPEPVDEASPPPFEPTAEFLVLQSMTKVEIDEMALSEGIKLDRRRTKARMIEQYLELR